MFGKNRKKRQLFGGGVEPRCAYCGHAAEDENGGVFCLLGREMKDGKCKKYSYDPLKREPRRAPALREYDPEEFKL